MDWKVIVQSNVVVGEGDQSQRSDVVPETGPLGDRIVAGAIKRRQHCTLIHLSYSTAPTIKRAIWRLQNLHVKICAVDLVIWSYTSKYPHGGQTLQKNEC